MEKNRTTVTLAGQDFRIVGSGSSEYIKKLEEMVNKRIEDVTLRYPDMSVNRCTLLAMLNMADELAALKNNYETLDAKISQLRDMPRVSANANARPVATRMQQTAAVTDKQPVGV